MTDLLWHSRQFDWVDLLDVLLVAVIFFWILYILRGTRAAPLLRGVVLLTTAVTLLSRIIRLRAFAWLMQQALPAFLVAIPVIFQQEMRRGLERLGRAGGLRSRSTTTRRATLAQTLTAVPSACRTLVERRHGALIVLERDTGLQEIADTGILLDAVISAELLTTVFDPNTVLHDGGAIVREGRVLSAACVLPLSTAFLADRQMGLRHRAALGVTEGSDAIVVVVSEERGSISIAHNGRIIRNLDARRLDAVLRVFFQPVLERRWSRWVATLRQAVSNRAR